MFPGRWGYILLLLSTEAAAQAEPASNDVVKAADDAFGRRVGIEEVGLYSENEVRGFDLQQAGNYRIGDHYFVRAANPTQPVLDSTVIRVGANGLRTDFASPSGSLQYELPEARAGVSGSLEAGWWGGSGPVLFARFAAAASNGTLGVAGGVQLNPWQHYLDGSTGRFHAIGLVPRLSPREGIKVIGIASRGRFRSTASSGFVTADGMPPPRVRRGVFRAQAWMREASDSDILGAIVELEPGGGWSAGGSLIRAKGDNPRDAFNLLTLDAERRHWRSAVVVNADTESEANAAEVMAGYAFGSPGLRHRISLMARYRLSRVKLGAGRLVELGDIGEIDDPRRISLPVIALDPGRGLDRVRQSSGGIAYRLTAGSKLEVRGDGQRTHYSKSSRTAGGIEERRSTSPWLYSGSVAAGVTSRITLFASYAKGLEEAGVAPAEARNRGAVLAPALARQAELGMKYAFAGGATLIAGLFQIAKPLAGLGGDGQYGFVGRVRHRGAEFSLAGRVSQRLNLVLGATLIDADLSGELVRSGEIGPRPVGRPGLVMLASATWEVPGLSGLSLDGGVNLRGERAANRRNDADLPLYYTLNAGLRHSFAIDGRPLTLRARITNLLDKFAWNASSSGLYTPNGSRAVTLTLSSLF